MKIKLQDKYILFPILILGLYFLTRLINLSKIISTFPLDLTNDITSYIGQLFLLLRCGFHELCPYWYNGFITFLNYAPGWEFFTLPILLLVKNIQLATYISIILIYILAFLALFYFGKSQKLSFTKIILFFLLLFANPITIGNFIRLGRIPSLFAWTMFIALAGLIFYYKDKPLDKKFILTSILFAYILITHQSEAILSSTLFISLFLIKKTKERIYIFFSILVAGILSSFWTIPFLIEFLKSASSSEWIFSQMLFDLSGQWFWTNVATFIVPPILFITSYFYFKTKFWKKKEILFFLPVFIISFLLLSRLIVFIPVLNQVYPDEYMFLILFFSAFFLLKAKYSENYQKFLLFCLLLISIVGVVVSVYHTSWFTEHTSLQKEMISITPFIQGKFLVFKDYSQNFYDFPFYAYASIYYNKSTPSGWAHIELNKEKLTDLKLKLFEIFTNKDCYELISHTKKIQTEEIVAFYENCDFLKTCGLKEVLKKGNVCIYSL